MPDKLSRETFEVVRDKIMRAAIYVRVSTEKQEKEGYSLDSQVELCLQYCKEHCYIVAPPHIYREVMTGTLYRERPQLSELRAAARKREFERLVVYDLDRLAREDTHQTVIMEDLAYNGVKTEAVRVNIEDTPAGRFMLHAYGFMAAVEREKILERMERGKRQRAQEGRLLGSGKASYGYDWNGDRTGYVINPEKAEVVRLIFQMAADGRSIRSIAAHLTDSNIPTSRGGQYWSTATISDMLGNLHYIGRAVAFREKHQRIHEGERIKHIITQRPEEEQVTLPEGAIPPIVDVVTFEKVQAQLEWNRQNASRNYKGVPHALLRCGLATCGYCGCAVVTHRFQRKGYAQEDEYYICGQPRTRLNRCPNFAIRIALLDAAVWEYAVEIIRDPARVEEALQAYKQQGNMEVELTPIESRLAAVARKMKNYNRVIDTAEDETIVDDAVAQLDKFAKEQRKLQQEKQAILTQLMDAAKEREAVEIFRSWCAEIRDKIDDPDYTPTYKEKRRACERLGIRATIWKKEHAPRYEITSTPVEIASVLPKWNTPGSSADYTP